MGEEDMDAKGKVANKTEEVIEVLSTVSPKPLPIQVVEQPTCGLQRATRGRGTKTHPYLVGFHSSRP